MLHVDSRLNPYSLTSNVVCVLSSFYIGNKLPNPNFEIFYSKSRQVNFPTDLFVGKDGRRFLCTVHAKADASAYNDRTM